MHVARVDGSGMTAFRLQLRWQTPRRPQTGSRVGPLACTPRRSATRSRSCSNAGFAAEATSRGRSPFGARAVMIGRPTYGPRGNCTRCGERAWHILRAGTRLTFAGPRTTQQPISNGRLDHSSGVPPNSWHQHDSTSSSLAARPTDPHRRRPRPRPAAVIDRFAFRSAAVGDSVSI